MWNSAPPKKFLTCIRLLQHHGSRWLFAKLITFPKTILRMDCRPPTCSTETLNSCNHEILSWAAQFYMVWIHNTSSEYSMILCQGSHICWAPCSSVKRYAHSCAGSKQFRRFQRTIQIGLPTNSHWSLSPLGFFQKGPVMMGYLKKPVHRESTRRRKPKITVPFQRIRWVACAP